MRTIRLGTRGSRLALIQSQIAAARLAELGRAVELVTVVTEGDTRPPGTVPGEGVFVTALERALSSGEIDLAVHSAKDVPLIQDPGLVIGAFPERADPRDVLVTASGGASLAGLEPGAQVGTDSPRRAGFLLAARADLQVRSFHGNVDSRIRRLDQGRADALVLAAAGLDRLGLGGRVDQRLEPQVVTPAPGQGALAIQARRDDHDALDLLARIDDPSVRLAVLTERIVLEATGGTCRSPVGALAEVRHGRIGLYAAAVTADGRQRHAVRLEADASPEAARRMAVAAGDELARRVPLAVRA